MMNEQNLEYLQERLFFHGFGEQLNKELQKNISAGKEQFELHFSGEFANGNKKDVVDYQLNFSKSKKSDNYFWNDFQATLKNEDPAKERTHRFNIRQGNGISGKKAYNMLQGNPVYQKFATRKEEGQEKPQTFKSWMEIDFANKDKYGNNLVNYYNDAYGFNLDRALAKIPAEGLQHPQQKERVKEALQRGENPTVTLEVDGKQEQVRLKANPRYKNVVTIDAHGRERGHNLGGMRPHGQEDSLKQKAGKTQDGQSQKADKSEKKSQGQTLARKRKRTMARR